MTPGKPVRSITFRPRRCLERTCEVPRSGTKIDGTGAEIVTWESAVDPDAQMMKVRLTVPPKELSRIG